MKHSQSGGRAFLVELVCAVGLVGLVGPGCLKPNPVGPDDDFGDETFDDDGAGEEPMVEGTGAEGGESGGSTGSDDGLDEIGEDAQTETETEVGDSEDAGAEDTGGSEDAGSESMGSEDGSQTCGNVDQLTQGCSTCLELVCCEALLGCADDLGCLCLLTCLLGGGEDEECSLGCSGALVSLPSLAGVLGCVSQSCANEC
ncbi:hypothetical protein G6O69_23195 [Pseudenhygromyxa sp. WMMC2535]|uniref:hypothetical protein n=1 Tax=Pseudenhygromyxa sp. WMMC2535 TaxID=2712867 RepID=UPI001557B21C|nr:hypothetical protein [Pseudenhygromyxa sp. WMMC2535]NVB40765.1 hypothetical protein [Pseudenhygromyxa sp. WMMC2535]